MQTHYYDPVGGNAVSKLKVDYELLRETERELSRIQRLFDDRRIDGHRDEIGSIWGPDSMQDAMADFHDNWEQNRKRMVESVESVGKLTAKAQESFSAKDKGLS